MVVFSNEGLQIIFHILQFPSRDEFSLFSIVNTVRRHSWRRVLTLELLGAATLSQSDELISPEHGDETSGCWGAEKLASLTQ